jgi:hypothetical protein
MPCPSVPKKDSDKPRVVVDCTACGEYSGLNDDAADRRLPEVCKVPHVRWPGVGLPGAWYWKLHDSFLVPY